MIVKPLSSIPFKDILDCFLLAFENYYVKMPTDGNYYKERWKNAKVDYGLSYGMFDKDRLVGFIIHAIDTRNGVLTAFNTGTGVIPEYRGRRIVQAIYDYALKDLEENGIEKITLEVITQNEAAIRAYKKVGFDICKKYRCFNGALKMENTFPLEVEKVDMENIPWDTLPNQHLYSWDNQRETILEGNFTFFRVLHQQEAESFFIIKSGTNYLAQLDLLKPGKEAWTRLFSAVKQKTETLKINNVDDRLQEKVEALSLIGLENSIDQYEMELEI